MLDEAMFSDVSHRAPTHCKCHSVCLSVCLSVCHLASFICYVAGQKLFPDENYVGGLAFPPRLSA